MSVARYADRPDRDDMEQCLRQIKEGSLAHFDRFYAQAAPFVMAIARRMLSDRMEAEDVCHDVLLEVIRKPDGYDAARGSVEAWLAVKTRSRCVDRLRRLQRVVPGADEATIAEAAASGAQPEERVLAKLEGEALRRALGELPLCQQRTLAAAYFEGKSQRELADDWRLPLGTVKSRVRYGLHHLRKALAKRGWAEPAEGEGTP